MSQQEPERTSEPATSLLEKYDSLPGILFSVMIVITTVGGGIWIYIASLGGGHP